MRFLTHVLVKWHPKSCPLPALRRFTSSFSGAAHASSASLIDRTFGIPVGGNGHVLLSVTESNASPKEAYPNVIFYLPPGPLFQQPKPYRENNDSDENEALNPCSSLCHNSNGNGIDHFRTQHHLASTTSSTVVTIHYRLGTLESIEEDQQATEHEEGEVIIDSVPQSNWSSPRRIHYQYPTPIHDTLAAFDWVQDTFQPTQTSILGTHIGGSIALMLALTEAQSIHAVAVLEPICDWTGLDDYCTVEEQGQDQDQDQTRSESENKRKSRKSKKLQPPAPSDLAPLLRARESFFHKSDRYFDTFTSPLLLLRSPGKPVPTTFPKYLTGPEYPVPMLKQKIAVDSYDDDEMPLDLWHSIDMPPDEGEVDEVSEVVDEVHSSSTSDSSDSGLNNGSDSTTPTTVGTTQPYIPRYRKALSRWPPYGLDWGLSGAASSNPYQPFQRLQRLQMTLPWVHFFVRQDNTTTTTDDNPNGNDETNQPESKGSPKNNNNSKKKKKKDKHQETVLSQQSHEMADIMRRACFWGREKGFGEKVVLLSTVSSSVQGDIAGDGGVDGMWPGTVEEEAGRWLFEVRGEPK